MQSQTTTRNLSFLSCPICFLTFLYHHHPTGSARQVQAGSAEGSLLGERGALQRQGARALGETARSRRQLEQPRPRGRHSVRGRRREVGRKSADDWEKVFL